jgi:hypothetical protein
MRLHYDSKLRRSLDKKSNYSSKDKFSLKESGRRSHQRKQFDSSKLSHEAEIRFLHLKNENRNSFGHLYQNYFGHKRKDQPRRLDSTNREGKEKTHDQKRRSLADLKSHFKRNKNEGISGIGKSINSRSKYDSLQSKFRKFLLI